MLLGPVGSIYSCLSRKCGQNECNTTYLPYVSVVYYTYYCDYALFAH